MASAIATGEQDPKSPFLFTSERGSPFTTAGFVERAGVEAKLGFPAHPHMLRHACGFALANKGHDTRALQAYLGHRNIQHTVRYTDLSPGRFKDFWRMFRRTRSVGLSRPFDPHSFTLSAPDIWRSRLVEDQQTSSEKGRRHCPSKGIGPHGLPESRHSG